MRAAALLLAALLPSGAASACLDIEAGADWTPFPGTEAGGAAVLDAYARGLWQAAPGLRPAGPQGHVARADADPAPDDAPGAGERVAPGYPFGALLIANRARRVWSYRDFQRTATGALIAGRPFRPGPLFARINDAPDGLGDNSGTVTLCLEIAEG